MQTEFVIAECNVYMKWKGGPPPRYRCYVNNELFTERTWIWTDKYLEEMIQIQAPPGHYEVRYELLDPDQASIKVRDLRVVEGPAIIDRMGRVQIYTPERK
jgi:hypothetical protein